MEQTNKVALENTNDYAINQEATAETFLSAIEETNNVSTDNDFVSLNTALPQARTMSMNAASSNDSGYVSSATADHYETVYYITSKYGDSLMLSAEQREKIESLANAGDFTSLKQYFNEIISGLNRTLANIPDNSVNKTLRNKIKTTIGILSQCAAMSSDVLLVSFFESKQVLVPAPPSQPTTPVTPSPATPTTPTDPVTPLAPETPTVPTTPTVPAVPANTKYYITSKYDSFFMLSAEQREKIEDLANAGDFEGIRNYFRELINNLNNTLSSIPNNEANKMVRNKIESTINILNQCLNLDQATLLSNLFELREVSPENPETNGQDTPQNPLESLGIIISQDVTDALIALSNDENFYEEYIADMLNGYYRGILFLNADQITELNRLVNIGNKKEFNQEIVMLLGELQRKLIEYTRYSDPLDTENQRAINKIESTIRAFNEWLTMDLDTIKVTAFNEKVQTPFLAMRSDKIDELREKITVKANLQKLLTMVTQAKGDSYNAILQILTQQSGYQKMNLEKLNDKQLESLNNYINTRTKEIATFVNKHNETEKAKIEKELAERKEREYGNIFLKLAAGLISLVVSIIAAIFSAGIAAPVVVSVIAACVDIVATARQTQSDIEIKKEQEKIEEYLALLRATEQKYATETLRRKKEELEKLQNEAEANSEYYQLLDLEIMQLNATLQNTALSYSNGWLKFDNSNYLQNVLRVQALINAMRLYAVLQKEEHEGRNRVAAELSLPGAYSGRGGDTIVNSRATVLLEKMNKLGELEIQMAEAYNRRKAVSEEIKQNRLRMGLDILGKAAFSFINLVTFGTGGTALAGALSGAGEAAYGMVSKYLLLINTSYNPTAPADFRAPNPSQEQFESLYSDLLAQSSELSRNLTANKKTLDYDKYLKLLKDIETRQIKEHLLSSISEAEKNSRGVIHQEMTDNKGRAQDAFVKIAGQQNITLLQDIAQKQAYLTKIQSQTINQQVDQRTEIANAGFNILLSAGAGFLSGQAQLAGTDKKTTDAFLYGLGSGLLSNSGKDIFDLLIGDSDLKLQTEDQQYSSSNFLSSGSFENMLAGDKNGNYTVSQNALLRNYAKLQRQILVEQALVSIHSAKQKARNIIHMELAEKSAPPAENAKAIAGYRQEGLLNRWNIFTEQAYTAAEQLSTKENRWTDLQRNFLINITSAALGGAAFAGGLTAEQSTGLQKLTYLSLQTITQLHALQDTSLDIANKVSAEHFSAGELTETLGFNRLAEAEAALFNEALELKASSGKYGFQVENKAWLEYLNMLLERLQKIKEITLRLNAAVRDSRSNVHSILDAAAVDSDSLIDDAIKLQSQFLRQTMQAIKQGDSEIVKRRNQRNSKKFELYLGLFSGAFQAFEALIPFFSESTTKEAMTLLAQDFQSFLPLLQAGFLQLNRGEHRAPELPDLSGLTKAERASVLSAQATAELALTNTPFQLWQKTIDLTEQGIRSLDKMAARKMTADIMEQRLEQLLAENRLQEARTKIESLASQQETRRRNIAEFFARLETNEYYASHILPAYELYQTGRSAEALAKLQEKCTENFLQGVNLSEQEIADIRALQDNLTSLLDADAGLSAARAELQALEADARVAGREFAQSLEYIRAHLGSNNEAQKIYFDLSADKDLLAAYQSDLSARFSEEKYYTVLHRYVLAGDAETENLENGLEAKTVEFMRAMRAYVQEYRGMLNAVLQVAPLFNSNEAAYKSLLEELALTAAFYGGEASLTFSALTKAQTWYGFTLKIYDGFISDYDFSFTAPALEQIALAQGKELTLNDWEYYVCISAIFRDSNFTLPAGVTSPEDIKAFANRQVDIAGQASNINASHSYTAPEADLGNLWAQYFIEHGQTQEKRDNLEKKQAALAAARNDLAAVERLFEVNGLTAEIDIAEAGLSGGALDYLQSLYGRGKIRFSQAMRDRVLEYLTRKKNNLEIDLLNSEADLDFAENLLDNDWANIQQKQTEYEDKLRRLAADGQEPTGEQIAELTRAREELERLERDYQRKRRSFLEQRRRGIIN